MSYSDASAAVGRDSDPTPVFYSSKQLHVTGMKIVAGSGVYPLSAIANFELQGRGVGFLFEVLKLGAVGLATMVGAAFVGRMAAPNDTETAWWMVGVGVVGAMVLLLACLEVVRYLREKTLHVRFVSGDNMKVSTWDREEAWAMHDAVEKALTYSINQTARPTSVADEIAKLSELRSRGAITDEDWLRAKDLFLGKQHSAQELAIAQLQQLFELRKTGVLSESEFNMKKWDVLARE